MAKKRQSSKKDAYTIVLEGIRSDFKVFGESLSFVRNEVKEHTKMMAEMKEDIMAMKENIIKIEEDLEILKADVAIIRHNQITRDEFKFLETRVSRLERKLK